MSNHPNFDRTQAVLDAVRQGDYAPAFDLYADDIQMENGPGAGPWHRGRGKDDMALMLTEFAGFFGNTFHQDGRCVYADDRMAICLFHETGTGARWRPVRQHRGIHLPASPGRASGPDLDR